jgi:hypothetical protein
VSRLTSTLDRIALHEQLRVTGGSCPRCRAHGCGCGGTCPRCASGRAGCGCARCRQADRRVEASGFESSRRRRVWPGQAPAPRPSPGRRPPPAPGQTRAPRDGPFSEWRGWGTGVTLQELLNERNRLKELRRTRAGRNTQPIRELRDFFRPGQNLYRITVRKTSNRPYLSIGQTGRSIAARVIHHYKPGGKRSRAERKLRTRMRAAGANRVLVQPGILPAGMPVRRAHGYEIWLQDRERVSDWRLIRNTRTFEDVLAASDAFAELQAAA